MTQKPPQTFIRNLFGHDFGALKLTSAPQSKPHMAHSADGMLENYKGLLCNIYSGLAYKLFVRYNENIYPKFFDLCLPEGFSPNGLNHSYNATATVVTWSDTNIAIHKLGLRGNKNASNGTLVILFGAIIMDTPL